MLTHRFATDLFVGVVELEGEGILGIRTLILDLGYFRKELIHRVANSLLARLRRNVEVDRRDEDKTSNDILPKDVHIHDAHTVDDTAHNQGAYHASKNGTTTAHEGGIITFLSSIPIMAAGACLLSVA
jgi:hypothetical protein